MSADFSARIVAAARSWIGTPYLHQASLKGVGCDCLGLVRGVWREVIGDEPEAPGAYSPAWAEADGGGVGRDLLPQLASPHGQVEFGTGGSAAHPDESEVAHRSPTGASIRFEVDDLPSTATGLEGVHSAEDAATDDDYPVRVHGTIVARVGRGSWLRFGCV